uniref:Uncharacterized protein n=1 Tax=Anguilla anguilla TaxID=7936 RepID=A0A0E9SVX5_ANGAN
MASLIIGRGAIFFTMERTRSTAPAQ